MGGRAFARARAAGKNATEAGRARAKALAMVGTFKLFKKPLSDRTYMFWGDLKKTFDLTCRFLMSYVQ